MLKNFIMNKKKIVGVMGSGKDSFNDLTDPLGKLIATFDVHLLTGGGEGVMKSVSQSFYFAENRKGMSIGIIKSRDLPLLNENTKTRNYIFPLVNEFVEIPVYTHLPFSAEKGEDFLSRNHINILTSNVIIALPGSKGTLSEVNLSLQYGKKVILFIKNYTIDNFSANELKSNLNHSENLIVCNSIIDVSQNIKVLLNIN